MSFRRAGFSLVELLVVIAVIGILAAILIPSVLHAIVNAKKSESLLELRQIGGATHLYLADNQYNFPPGWGGGQGTYAQHISPYLNGRDDRSAENPFNGPFGKPITIVQGNSGQVISFPITYSANPLIFRDVNVDSRRVSLDQIARHAGTIMLTDGCQKPGNHNQANATFYGADNFGIWSSPPANLSDSIDVGPDTDEDSSEGHIRYPKGTACSLFVDGSAHKIRKGEMTHAHIFLN